MAILLKIRFLKINPMPKILRPRRENFRHKYVVVVRDENNKVLARRRWSPKTFNLNQASNIYSTNQTFDSNIKKESLTNVREVVDRNKRPSKPRRGKWQYVVEYELDDGTIISARSNLKENERSVSRARQEATTSANERLAQHFNQEYDQEIGNNIFEDNRGEIRRDEGIVYYEAIT